MKVGQLLLLSMVLACPARGDFFLSKVLMDSPGIDNELEAIEIQGDPEASLDGYWVLFIEGNEAQNPGTIDQKIDLTGLKTGANGLLLIRDSSIEIQPAPDSDTAIAIIDFKPDLENGSNTIVLGTGRIADKNADLDTNDDGTIDGDISGFRAADAVWYRTTINTVAYADDFGGASLWALTDFQKMAIYRISAENCGKIGPARWAIGQLEGEDSGPFTWKRVDGTWGFEEIELDDVDPHFGALNIIVEGECGACCFLDQTCTLTDTKQDCLARGGRFMGEGTSCDGPPCPVGACCWKNGTCEMSFADECEGTPHNPAQYLGDGTTCEADCNVGPKGACCVADFEGFRYCTEVSEEHCSAWQGVFKGVDTPCTDACNLCCVPDGTCLVPVTKAECDEIEGFYVSDPYTRYSCNPADDGPYRYYACRDYFSCDGSVRGDSDGSGAVDFGDIDCFISAMIEYQDWLTCGTASPEGQFRCVNDINLDGQVNFNDIDGFVQCLLDEGCP